MCSWERWPFSGLSFHICEMVNCETLLLSRGCYYYWGEAADPPSKNRWFWQCCGRRHSFAVAWYLLAEAGLLCCPSSAQARGGPQEVGLCLHRGPSFWSGGRLLGIG